VTRQEEKVLGRELNRRYRIISVLGSGGFGKTYLAKDAHQPGSPSCVVKQMLPAHDDIRFLEIARRLFNAKAEIVEELSKHSQIPQLLAYFEENKEFYLVEEFIKGHPISEEISTGKRFSVAEALDLLRSVLQILVFIHNHSVIHRDIKPSNIIKREQDSQLVLIDFGAVKQVQNQALGEGFTSAVGTSDYAPPEQLIGQPKLNSDIYALGITAIQALTGIPPNKLQIDPHNGAVSWRHLVQVKEEFAEILDKMTCFSCYQRYRSATEVLQDLEKLENSTASISEAQVEFLPQLVPSPEQYARLEEMLMELIGPIAPILLRRISTQVRSPQELKEQLVLHLPAPQRSEFEQQSGFLLQEPPVQLQARSFGQVQTQSGISPNLPKQAVDDSFVRQCEEDLADLIGPIATFLVQKVLKSHPQISSVEFVEALVTEIPDPRRAFEFRQRLLP
jgi:serine/threonine-protein kinase